MFKVDFINILRQIKYLIFGKFKDAVQFLFCNSFQGILYFASMEPEEPFFWAIGPSGWSGVIQDTI
jgi:hypothetical protein